MPGRLLIIGAHPDDCEYMAGGLAAQVRRAGWRVGFLTATDGSAGHHEMRPGPLIRRRKAEAAAAAGLIGATSLTLGEPDGRLYVSERTTGKMIAAIRRFKPDVLVSHRTGDYHRDHRMAAQLVLDASFLLQVPRIVPAVPPLDRVPVMLYASDRFTEGPRFRADVVIDIGREVDTVAAMLACHVSQFREWLPWVEGDKRAGRKRPASPGAGMRDLTARARQAAKTWARGRCRFAEAFQISEYGRRITPAELRALLPR